MPTDVLEQPAAGSAVVVDTGGPGTHCASPKGGDGPGGEGASRATFDPHRFGLWLFLGVVSMLFISFTSAYIVRRAGGRDWHPLTAPPLLWINTGLLLASSLTLEIARRRLRAWDLPGVSRGVGATGVLGGAFVVGQVFVWRA